MYLLYLGRKKSLSYHKTNEEDDDSSECSDNGNELPGGENQTCLIGIVVSVVVDEWNVVVGGDVWRNVGREGGSAGQVWPDR